MGGLLHLVQQGGELAGQQPAQAPRRCTKCNSPSINGQYAIHRIYNVVYITNGPSLCGFNVPIKGLTPHRLQMPAEKTITAMW